MHVTLTECSVDDRFRRKTDITIKNEMNAGKKMINIVRKEN